MRAVGFKPNIGRANRRGGASVTSAQVGFEASIKQQMDAIVENFKQWTNHIDEQSANVLEDALEPTFEWSQEIVPVLTGELKESGYLETRSFRGRARVEIGYGRGGLPDYAIVVHEDLEAHHEEPTQAKFLQMPLEADEANIMERIRQGYQFAAGLSS